MSVRANINLSIDATLAGSGDLGTPKQRVVIEKALEWLGGTDAVNKADILFQDTRTLAASANENLDLAGLLTNAFGATIAAAEVLLIYIAAASGNANNVNVTRPVTNGFAGPFLAAGDGISVKPGEFVPLISQSGWPVVAATGDLLNVANSAAGSSVDYDIVIIGRTVAA